jgi:hypothetical protein
MNGKNSAADREIHEERVEKAPYPQNLINTIQGYIMPIFTPPPRS